MKTSNYQTVDALHLKRLREMGLITSEEIAFFAGDLVIAEHVVNKTRRVLGDTTLLSESKRLLKG